MFDPTSRDTILILAFDLSQGSSLMSMPLPESILVTPSLYAHLDESDRAHNCSCRGVHVAWVFKRPMSHLNGLELPGDPFVWNRVSIPCHTCFWSFSAPDFSTGGIGSFLYVSECPHRPLH